MAKLVWDVAAERLFETGVKNGVLYPFKDGTYQKGVVWNGLISVTESPSGAEPTALYADDMKYLNLMSPEEFGATIEAYMYPAEFAACNGEVEIMPGMTIGQQSRKTFGLSYKTSIGNAENDALGYKIHIIYGCLAAPSEKAYSSINDSPEATTFSWEISTTPVAIDLDEDAESLFSDNGMAYLTELKPTAVITIESVDMGPAAMNAIEEILYGSNGSDPRLPLPGEVLDILKMYLVG